MRLFVLASNNKKKLEELKEILAGADMDIVTMREAGCDFEVNECGATFEENAYLKAIAVTEMTGKAAIADDSGLVVAALGGAPGVHSARYGASPGQSDEFRNKLLLENMRDIKERGASFVSCVCCTMPDGSVLTARGECAGRILYAPRGEGGFGYDPIFELEGIGKTMAELEPNEKNMISHRGLALRNFLNELRNYDAYK